MSVLTALATIGQKRKVDPGIIAGPRQIPRMFTFAGRELTAADLRSVYNDLTYAFLNFRANELAAHILDATVQRQTAQQEWEEVEQQFPWVSLLQRPSLTIPPFEFWHWAVQIYDAWGHADFVVEDGNIQGIPVPKVLHPIYPEFGTLYPRLGTSGSKIAWDYYPNDGRKPIQLRLEDIVSIRRPHPVDPGRTASLIEASAYQIDTETAASIYSRDNARQQGRPTGVVLHVDDDATLDEPAKRKLSVDFYEQYSLRRVKGVPVLDGVKAKPVQLGARDQQFIQTREFTESRMFFIWGVHKGLYSENATEANAKAALMTVSRFNFQPALKSILSQVEFSFEKIFRADPAMLRIQPPNVIPIDPEQQAKIDEVKIKSGTRLINEVRRRDGDDEVEGGDEPLVSAGLVPLSQVGLV